MKQTRKRQRTRKVVRMNPGDRLIVEVNSRKSRVKVVWEDGGKAYLDRGK